MCSLNWRKFNDRLSLVFTRDESVLRAPSLPPQRFAKGGIEYLMPVDPVGGGSWISANSAGFIFCLLNDYQGQLKSAQTKLISRGQLIKQLSECKSMEQVQHVIKCWLYEHSQPFYLLALSNTSQTIWHFDGIRAITNQPAPEQVYSSGHPDVESIQSLRAKYVKGSNPKTISDLIRLHQSHQPVVGSDLAYSLCMHREEACSQSLTVIELATGEVNMRYWQGQPCEANLDKPIAKSLLIT